MGISELTTTILTGNEVRDLVQRMLKSSGRRVDLSSPFVDAALPDGSRLHVVIPDITRSDWAVNIRKFSVRATSLDDLVTLGTLTPQMAEFLVASVVAGLNILVSGGTQAGPIHVPSDLTSDALRADHIYSAFSCFHSWLKGWLFRRKCSAPERLRGESHCHSGTPLGVPNPLRVAAMGGKIKR